MTPNMEVLELAVDLFILAIQNERVPDFSKCLQHALEIRQESADQFKEDIEAHKDEQLHGLG